MEKATTNKTYFSKKTLWQWIIIYLIIGAIVYGAIYFFFLHSQGRYSYGSTNNTENSQQPQTGS